MASLRPSHVKVVCPTADTIPVTLNAGFRMPSWFDLKTLDAGGPEDEEGMQLTEHKLESQRPLCQVSRKPPN